MKITAKELKENISRLKGIVPKDKNVSDAQKGILYKEGRFIASNSELTVILKGEDSFSETFFIPENAFDILSALTEDVELSLSGKRLSVKSGSVKSSFMTFDAGTFNYVSGMDATGTSDIPAEAFYNALNHVLFVVEPAASDNKAALSGVLLKCSGGKLDFVGMNSHQIAKDSIPLDGEFSLIVPKSSLAEIIRQKMEGSISISFDQKGVLFTTEKLSVYSRLLEGEYFQYEKILNTDGSTSVIDRVSLQNALARINACASSTEKRPCILEFGSSDMVKISFENQFADYDEDIPCSCSGTDKSLRIGFNPRLLMAAVKSFEEDEVDSSVSVPTAPIRLSSGEHLSIVLPVNIAG